MVAREISFPSRLCSRNETVTMADVGTTTSPCESGYRLENSPSSEEAIAGFDVVPPDQIASSSTSSHCSPRSKLNFIKALCASLVVAIAIACVVDTFGRGRNPILDATVASNAETTTSAIASETRTFCSISPGDLPGVCSKFYNLEPNSDCCDAMVFFTDPTVDDQSRAKTLCDRCNSTSNENIQQAVAYQRSLLFCPEPLQASSTRKLTIARNAKASASLNDSCTNPITPTCTLPTQSDLSYVLSQVDTGCCTELIRTNFDFTSAPIGGSTRLCHACGRTQNPALREFLITQDVCLEAHLHH